MGCLFLEHRPREFVIGRPPHHHHHHSQTYYYIHTHTYTRTHIHTRLRRDYMILLGGPAADILSAIRFLGSCARTKDPCRYVTYAYDEPYFYYAGLLIIFASDFVKHTFVEIISRFAL